MTPSKLQAVREAVIKVKALSWPHLQELENSIEPLRLADVLLAIEAITIHPIIMATDGRMMKVIHFSESGFSSAPARWDLKKDSLEDQSEETIEFLYQLLKP